MQGHKFFLVIGGLFGAVAGLMIYLISYNELVKHFATREYPIKISLKAAFSTFILFLVLSFILSFFIKM